MKHAWRSYIQPVLEGDGYPTKTEFHDAQARHFAESMDRFLDAADFLHVSTNRRYRCLDISRRTYFYWVRTIKGKKCLSFRYSTDYRLWLVWNCVELAKLKLDSEDLVRSWFCSPNRLLSNPDARTGGPWLKPIDLLFDYDIRRRPRVLRVLLDMPPPEDDKTSR